MKRKKTPAYYDSLDAPVYVWQKVHETLDMSWLLIKRQKVSGRILSKLAKAWEKMYDEYLEEFGFSDEFISIMRKKIYIAKMKMEMIISGDRSMQTFIEIEEEELAEMTQAVGKSNFMDCKIAIEKHNGFQIKMKETSIREFYYYLKQLK